MHPFNRCAVCMEIAIRCELNLGANRGAHALSLSHQMSRYLANKTLSNRASDLITCDDANTTGENFPWEVLATRDHDSKG